MRRLGCSEPPQLPWELIKEEYVTYNPFGSPGCISVTNGWVAEQVKIANYQSAIVAYFMNNKDVDVQLLEVAVEDPSKCSLPAPVWGPQRLCGRVRYPAR
jgi:hypothetical protein